MIEGVKFLPSQADDVRMITLVLIAAVVTTVTCIVALQAYVSLLVADASAEYLQEAEAVPID